MCIIGFFSKCEWVVPLKDKEGVTTVNAFQKILNNSKRKPNKIWVDQGSEFYSSHFKEWLKDNEGKSVVAERFIWTLKNKMYKHIKPISKNVNFVVLNDIVDEYNNTYHRTIKMKPTDVRSDSSSKYNEKSYKKDPRFKAANHVRISKYKNILAKAYVSNWSEEIFVISKIKNRVPWTYVISDLNGEESVGNFHEKELQKTNQEKFKIEKVIKRKGNKLYIKWEDNYF